MHETLHVTPHVLTFSCKQAACVHHEQATEERPTSKATNAKIGDKSMVPLRGGMMPLNRFKYGSHRVLHTIESSVSDVPSCMTVVAQLCKCAQRACMCMSPEGSCNELGWVGEPCKHQPNNDSSVIETPAPQSPKVSGQCFKPRLESKHASK